MLDEVRLKEALVQYKRDFVSTQWKHERYKWEAIKTFQDNWDVNAADFADMLTRSLSKTYNLLSSMNHFPAGMITGFAKSAPEEVRAMFIALFDENVDVIERILAFKEYSSTLLEKYGNGAANHYQSDNTVSIYLWLRYPDKYYIYKYGEVKAVAEKLGSNYRFKRGASSENLRNFYAFYNEIREYIRSDAELISLFQTHLSDTCYPDPEYRTLTVDIGFYISRFYLESEPAAPSEWLPQDYSPEITTETWAALLHDSEVFTNSSLEIVKRMKDYGGQASCVQLASKYGESPNFYNSGSTALARRIADKTGCPVMTTDDGSTKYWPILYVGKNAGEGDEGTFIWKLRNELAAALDIVELPEVSLYANATPAIWKISHGTERTGISDVNKKIFMERNVVVVHSKTGGKGVSKISQGQNFMEYIQKGDYFYLCYGNSIQLLGQITNDDVIENPEMLDGWCERKYSIIAQTNNRTPYEGQKKWWTPNDNSTCIKINERDYPLFEELILQPYFHMSVEELLIGTNENNRDDFDFTEDSIRDENPPVVEQYIEKYNKSDFLSEVFMSEQRYDMLAAVLKNKQNIILQGAPGVGKTFAAKRLAYSIMGEKDESRIAFVQFHQNYSYEDFMMGYKPSEDGFELKTGIFYRFCQKAASQPEKDFFFIIDEINRGNMSKIFGELLMLIEKDYRGTETTLAYNGKPFSVPEKLYIIGMMNTADRSLAMIDYALRRRFSFFEMEPGFDSEGFTKYQNELNNETFHQLIEKIKELNKEITDDRSLGKGFCIGHSYFSNWNECTDEKMQAVVDFDILPMLEEYWFDDTAKLQRWSNILHGVFQ